MKQIFNSLFDFFASLKLAVVLLIFFTVLLIWATIYESNTSTAEAQQLIYKTAWFDLLLIVLGLNLSCSALSRFPWKKKHIPFLLTHTGILIILAGAMVTRKFGIEGQLGLFEGETADFIMLDEIAFTVAVPRLNVRKDFEPSFIDTPIPEGKELRYRLDEANLDCYIDRFIHQSMPSIHVRVENQGKSTETSVNYNQPISIQAGDETVELFFGNKQIPLGFSIQLIDFRALRYPGTNRPQRFESEVKLIDPASNIERNQLIYMNNPLAYNKYLFYQSSYEEGTANRPDRSIFSVAYAPGTSIIYFGSIVMVLGMLTMFIRKRKTKINFET